MIYEFLIELTRGLAAELANNMRTSSTRFTIDENLR